MNKVPLWRRIFCKLGWHQWKELNHECMQIWFIGMDEHAGLVEVCNGCQKPSNGQCTDCKESGSGTCYRLQAEKNYKRQLRANCCIHCPPTSHQH